MDQIYPDQCLIDAVQRWIGAGKSFHLFTNNVTPTLDTTLSMLTEASWTGYNPVTVLFASWGLYNVSAHLGSGQGPPCLFVNGTVSPVVTYGYFIIDITSSLLAGIARFDAAPVSIGAGDSFPVVPIYATYSGLSS